MNSDKKLSFKIIKKIIFIVAVIISFFTVGVLAAKDEVNYVTIIYPEGCQTTVLTSKSTVSDILKENKIIILPDESVYPNENSKLSVSKTITILRGAETKIVAEEIEKMSTEEILGEYVTVVEKIVIEQVEIPYETISKDVSFAGSSARNKIIVQGSNGIKEVKYRVKYQNDVEIDREIVSENIIKNPTNQIVQVTAPISSRSNVSRTSETSETVSASVEGITPTIANLNTSAYCACMLCCGKTNGITSSGAVAKEWYTVAAGSKYKIGTVIYIPALADKPNGGWFVVQDRGGAISNNKLDIFMGSHSAATQYGRKTLECYIYEK